MEGIQVVVDPLKLPEGVLTNAIAVAISTALDDMTRAKVIEDVVRAHLSVKQNSYDRETLLSAQVGNAIRSMAKKALEERLEVLRPEVDNAVKNALGPNFDDEVMDQLKAALSQIVLGSIQINVKVGAARPVEDF